MLILAAAARTGTHSSQKTLPRAISTMDDDKTVRNLMIMVGMLAALGVAIYFTAGMVSEMGV